MFPLINNPYLMIDLVYFRKESCENKPGNKEINFDLIEAVLFDLFSASPVEIFESCLPPCLSTIIKIKVNKSKLDFLG